MAQVSEIQKMIFSIINTELQLEQTRASCDQSKSRVQGRSQMSKLLPASGGLI